MKLLPVQRMGSEALEVLMKFYAFKHQQSYSVIRCLHAEHGFWIARPVRAFLRSQDGRALSDEVKNEIRAAVGFPILVASKDATE